MIVCSMSTVRKRVKHDLVTDPAITSFPRHAGGASHPQRDPQQERYPFSPEVATLSMNVRCVKK
jgi:hypothetical protein